MRPVHQLAALPRTGVEALQLPERARLAARLAALDAELAAVPTPEPGPLLLPWDVLGGPDELIVMSAAVRGPALPPVTVWRVPLSPDAGPPTWQVSASSGRGLPRRRELGPADRPWTAYRGAAEAEARAAGWTVPLHPDDLARLLSQTPSPAGELEVREDADALGGHTYWLGTPSCSRWAWLEARNHAVRLVLDHQDEKALMPVVALVYDLPQALAAATLFLRGSV